jgi:thermostable 8-oxoguanine DNA glycosylase
MKAIEYEDDLNQFLQRYEYQPFLTGHLDNLDGIQIDQSLLNEIVLWKVNRYVALSQELFDHLNSLTTLTNGQHRQGKNVLELLLKVRGADLPMASTFLRFRNPEVFQIIDRHAYRAVYDQKYSLYQASPTKRKISVYFDYIDRLIELCAERNVEFQTIDRLLYEFDKRTNGKL